MLEAASGKIARPLLMKGGKVGLALMCADDVPSIARWNQDLEFTARLATPGDAHTVEIRQEVFRQNSRIRADSAEFSVIERDTGALVGFGGLFDMTRALAATLFVGIGEPAMRGNGLGTEAAQLICEYGFFFRSLYNIKVEVHEYNREAVRFYERLVFRPAGRIRGVNLLNGRRYDEIVMDLIRDEYSFRHVGEFAHLEAD